MKPGTPSEGHYSALDLLMAIGPLHGSERPDVGLTPYMLTRHAFARVDTRNAPIGAMAVSAPWSLPYGHKPLEQRG